MRKWSIATVPTLLLFMNAHAAVGDIAPDFTLETPDGTPVTLSDSAANKTTVLLFWATWCPYCKALMPHLQSMRLEHGDKVEILAISIREDGDPIEFISKAGYDFTLLTDGDAVADTYDIWSTPGVIIVDGERRVRFDLYDLPGLDPPDIGETTGHTRRAAYLAPYWAAEIRKSIDEVLSN